MLNCCDFEFLLLLYISLSVSLKLSSQIMTSEQLDEIAEKYKSGRLYIPHGYGKEAQYKPHVNYQNVSYTECGPDWKSKLRYIPSPKPKEGEPDHYSFIPPLKSIRHFPDHNNVSYKEEYTFYPPLGSAKFRGTGKQTIFDNIHKASLISSTEITDSMHFGNRKIPASSRNGITEASPGDKPYQAAEYAPGFHKLGSTRAVVNFGQKRVLTRLNPTVVFNEAVLSRVKPYVVKEAERKRLDEIDTVRSLDCWKPASPLVVPVYETKSAV